VRGLSRSRAFPLPVEFCEIGLLITKEERAQRFKGSNNREDALTNARPQVRLSLDANKGRLLMFFHDDVRQCFIFDFTYLFDTYRLPWVSETSQLMEL
jgi:hypothetical protein